MTTTVFVLISFASYSAAGVPADLATGGTKIAVAEDWTVADGTRSSIVSHSKEKSLRLYAESGKASITADLSEDPKSTEDFSEVGVYVTSISENECTAELSVTFDSGTVSVSAHAPKAEKYYVFLPIPNNAASVKSVSVTVSVKAPKASEALPVSAIIGSAVLFDTDHTENIKTYSAFDIVGLDKDSAVSDKVPVIGSSVAGGIDGKSYAAAVKLSGKSGGIAFHFSDNGKDFAVCGSAVITEGRTSYIFPIGEITVNSSYKIEFTGTENSNVRLEGVSFIPVTVFEKNENLGTVSKCSFSDDTVYVSGSITRDAAVKHINGEVCLYEVPMWANADTVLNSDPVDSIKMSTSFSFTLPTPSDYSVFVSYIVAIKDKDGIYPLSDAVYPSFAEIPENRAGTVAVSGILPEEAFTHGFDRYVIDTDISEFLLTKSGQDTAVFTYDGYSYYLNKEFLSDVEKKVRFLTGAGIGIIFRLSDSSGDFVKGVDQCRKIAAATSYLSDTFSPVGIILDNVPSKSAEISEKAYDTAAIIRMISAATNSKSTVTVPVDQTENGEIFAWLLSEYISNYPKINMEIMILGNSGTHDISEGIMACAVDGGYSLQFTLEAPLDKDTPLSFSDMIMSSTGISYLMQGTSDTLPQVSADTYKLYPVTDGHLDGSNVTVDLWNFTESYDSSGFTVPEGDTGIFTGTDDALEKHTGIHACRALKTVLNHDSGVIMAKPASPLNLTGYSKVQFMLATENSVPAEINIVFISGKERAVFPFEIGGAGVYTPVCDLASTGISDNVERIAIVLTKGEALPVSIASVTACGNGGSGIDSGIYITEVSGTGIGYQSGSTIDTLPVELTAIISITVITVVVFVILTKKKTQ